MPVQPFESVARMTSGNEPVWVGVPSRTPVAVWKVIPAGSVPLNIAAFPFLPGSVDLFPWAGTDYGSAAPASKKLRASMALLRKNSNPEPWG